MVRGSKGKELIDIDAGISTAVRGAFPPYAPFRRLEGRMHNVCLCSSAGGGGAKRPGLSSTALAYLAKLSKPPAPAVTKPTGQFDWA